jgi:hypothetical protein
MRAAVERHIEKTARDYFGNATFVRKSVGGVELQEWQSEDGARRIVTAFVNTTVIIANDETAVLHAVEAATGNRPSLKTQSEVDQVRRVTDSASAALFGFVTGESSRCYKRTLGGGDGLPPIHHQGTFVRRYQGNCEGFGLTTRSQAAPSRIIFQSLWPKVLMTGYEIACRRIEVPISLRFPSRRQTPIPYQSIASTIPAQFGMT